MIGGIDEDDKLEKLTLWFPQVVEYLEAWKYRGKAQTQNLIGQKIKDAAQQGDPNIK